MPVKRHSAFPGALGAGHVDSGNWQEASVFAGASSFPPPLSPRRLLDPLPAARPRRRFAASRIPSDRPPREAA